MSYSDDAFATIMLMSQVTPDRAELVSPLTIAEYHNLRERVNDSSREMSALADMDMSGLMQHLSLTEKEAYRVCLLLNRVLPISLSIEEFMNAGIGILTLFDDKYPDAAYDKLGKKAPPMLYCAGQTEILRRRCVAILGNEPLTGDAEARVRNLVDRALFNGLAIVNDGMPGFGRIAEDQVYASDGVSIEVLPGGMGERLKDERVQRMIGEEKLLLLSIHHPDAPVSESHAAERNKLLNSIPLSSFVFAARENSNTFIGAAEALKLIRDKYIYAWDTPLYPGNAKLLNLGAIPFDGDDARFPAMLELWLSSVAEQMSLFDEVRPFV